MKKSTKQSIYGKLFWFFVNSILYTYIGYPVIIAILAKIRPQKTKTVPTTPTVTLLIPAYNEEVVIAEKLKNSLALEYPSTHLQILVISDGSDDNTPKIVREFQSEGVELLHESARNGKMAAINRAMPYARGEIIVFSDGNNMYTPETIKKLIAPFSDPEIGAVSGAKMILQGDGVLGESEGFYWKYESWIKNNENKIGCVTGTAGEIFALRRSCYQSPPSKIINDDFYLAMQVIRQGYRIAYAPEAISYERISPSAQAEIKRRTRIIAGRYQAMSMSRKLLPLNNPLVTWQIISHKFLRPLVPFFMIGAAITNLLTVIKPSSSDSRSMRRLTPPFNKIFLALQSIFYSLAWIGNRVGMKGRMGNILYLPTFLVNSNLAALQGLIRYTRGEASPLWERIPRREQTKRGISHD